MERRLKAAEEARYAFILRSESPGLSPSENGCAGRADVIRSPDRPDGLEAAREGEPMYRDPDRYAVTRGGGCLMLFGLPFLAAGILVIVMGLLGKMNMEGGGPAPLLLVIPFGLVFALVGAGLMFGRAGIVIDKRSRTVTRWWGLLVPFKSETFPVEKVKAVTISREVRTSHSSKGGSRSYTVYPVRLAGAAKPVDVEESRDYEKARHRAEEVAKFLEVGLEDSSTGEKVVREAGTLDESLRDRYRREERPRERPEVPAGCRILSGASGSEATFDIPPKGFAVIEIIGMVLGAAFAFVPLIFLGPMFFGSSDSEGFDIEKMWPLAVFLGVFMLLWLGFPLVMIVGTIKKATARVRLTVSPRELRLERRTFLGTKALLIPADELEELEVGAAGSAGLPSARAGARGAARMGAHPVAALFGVRKVVTARSDRATLTFGAGLRPDELKWLRDVVLFIVTA